LIEASLKLLRRRNGLWRGRHALAAPSLGAALILPMTPTRWHEDGASPSGAASRERDELLKVTLAETAKVMSTAPPDRTSVFVLALVAAVTALRIGALMASAAELQFDEAQYWFWAQTFDWGYFSKPPLVAWAIAATTALFGDAEWAVRLAAPVAQGAAALALFSLGRGLYGPWPGVMAGAAWLLLPAVFFSANLISTDALLLPLWALALRALWRLHETQAWRWALTLGAAIGLGALAKYAMLYFLAGAALAALIVPELRRTLLSSRGALAGAGALACLAPNLVWNATHDFATVSHTVANVDSERFGLHPDKLIEFLGGQALIIGPVLFVALGWLGWTAARAGAQLPQADRFLAAFVVPPLAVISVQALLSHAHANWAVAAYPAAIVWLCGRLMAARPGRIVLFSALALNALLGGAIQAALISPSFADRIGLANAFEDGRGWRAVAAATAARARAAGPLTAVAVDHRALFFELTYYWRRAGVDAPAPRMWLLHADPRNHAEAVAPLTAENGARVLFVHMQPRYEAPVAADFTRHTPILRQDFPLGDNAPRTLLFALAEGFAPAPRDAAFEARYGR
jgi:4-amino-4-deoxy-L-arabinose transferase-like glycosyltransferase